MRSSKLGRTSAHRRALYRNLVTSLLEHERIATTDAKAKQLRRLADRMITLGKRGTLHARRRALRVIRSADVTAKVFDDLADRYRDRAGGYTRVLKLRRRVGDAAPLSLVELVGGEARRGAASGGGKKAAADKPARKAAKPDKKAAPKAKKTAAAKPAGGKPSGGKGGRGGARPPATRGRGASRESGS
jgi:large subunit ribosomal protein L17